MGLLDKFFKKEDNESTHEVHYDDQPASFEPYGELDDDLDDVVSVSHLNLSFELLGLLDWGFVSLPNNTDIEDNPDDELNRLLVYERVVFLRNFINIFDYSWKTDDIKSILRKVEYSSTEDYTVNYRYYPYGKILLDSIYQWYHDRLKGTYVNSELVPAEFPVHIRQMYYIGLKFVDMYLSDLRSIVKKPIDPKEVGYYTQEYHQYGYSFSALLVGLLAGTNLLPLNKKAKKIVTYFNKVVQKCWVDIVESEKLKKDIEAELLFGLVALRLLHEPNWDGTLYDGTKLEGVRELFELPEVKQNGETMNE